MACLLAACALAGNSFRTELHDVLQGRNAQRLLFHFVLDRFETAPHLGSRSPSQLRSVRARFPSRFLSSRSPGGKTSRASIGAWCGAGEVEKPRGTNSHAKHHRPARSF